jgi:ATP-dependent DNA helicase RecQ
LFYSGLDVRTNLWLIEHGSESEAFENDPLREQLLKRDRDRLRDMTYYCATSDCLRGFILKYFGENPPLTCDCCGNCATNFEITDITVPTKKILSCVARMRGRYGLNMVIDTLRGSKNERIIRAGLDRLPTYGIYDESDRQLRVIMQHLILSEYLIKTSDEYPVIKLGERANEVLRNGATVQMKLPKEKSVLKPEKKSAVRSVDKQLFAVLRAVRQSIANEQNLPAFVIFHDSTLTDMCMKIPTTLDALLEVSGIGKIKAERYGQRFLDAISEFLDNNKLSETIDKPTVDVE